MCFILFRNKTKNPTGNPKKTWWNKLKKNIVRISKNKIVYGIWYCNVNDVLYIKIVWILAGKAHHTYEAPKELLLNFKQLILTSLLKWWKVLLGRKFSELLYLSDVRISQVNFPAMSGKAATLNEKHARFFKQENAHDKLFSTTRLTRAVIFKKKNFAFLKLPKSISPVFTFWLIMAPAWSAKKNRTRKSLW